MLIYNTKKNLFFFYLIFSIINNFNHSSSHRNSNQSNRGGQSSGNKHSGGKSSPSSNMSYQTNAVAQPIQTNQPAMNNQMMPMNTGQPIQTNQPAMNNQMIPMNTGNQPILSNQMMPMNTGNQPVQYQVTSGQINNNSQQMSIIMTLDPAKATILVAEIKTLQKNYKILSEMIQASVLMNYTGIDKKNSNTNQELKLSYQRILNNQPFDPKKQILNEVSEGYLNGIQPESVAINPFTKQPVTLSDVNELKMIRTLYQNAVELMMLYLGLDDACSWNVRQIKSNPSLFKSLLPAAGVSPSNVYGLNLLRPLWKESANFIANGNLTKGFGFSRKRNY